MLLNCLIQNSSEINREKRMLYIPNIICQAVQTWEMAWPLWVRNPCVTTHGLQMTWFANCIVIVFLAVFNYLTLIDLMLKFECDWDTIIVHTFHGYYSWIWQGLASNLSVSSEPKLEWPALFLPTWPIWSCYLFCSWFLPLTFDNEWWSLVRWGFQWKDPCD